MFVNHPSEEEGLGDRWGLVHAAVDPDFSDMPQAILAVAFPASAGAPVIMVPVSGGGALRIFHLHLQKDVVRENEALSLHGLPDGGAGTGDDVLSGLANHRLSIRQQPLIGTLREGTAVQAGHSSSKGEEISETPY